MFSGRCKNCPPSPVCPDINDTLRCRMKALRGQQITVYFGAQGLFEGTPGLTGILDSVGADFLAANAMVAGFMRAADIPLLAMSAATLGGPLIAGAGAVGPAADLDP